jgi:N-formylglutamate amidohydrolase
MMEDIFKRNGFSVSLNHPYSGGFITTHYGEQLVAAKCFAVQIEINQDLYMPSGEQRLLPDKIDQTRENIFQSLDHIAGNL